MPSSTDSGRPRIVVERACTVPLLWIGAAPRRRRRFAHRAPVGQRPQGPIGRACRLGDCSTSVSTPRCRQPPHLGRIRARCRTRLTGHIVRTQGAGRCDPDAPLLPVPRPHPDACISALATHPLRVNLRADVVTTRSTGRSARCPRRATVTPRCTLNRPGFDRDSSVVSGDQTGQVAQLPQSLELGWWPAPAGSVKSPIVVPVHPCCGGDVDFSDIVPRPAGLYQLGLVQADR